MHALWRRHGGCTRGHARSHDGRQHRLGQGLRFGHRVLCRRRRLWLGVAPSSYQAEAPVAPKAGARNVPAGCSAGRGHRAPHGVRGSCAGGRAPRKDTNDEQQKDERNDNCAVVLTSPAGSHALGNASSHALVDTLGRSRWPSYWACSCGGRVGRRWRRGRCGRRRRQWRRGRCGRRRRSD